MSTIASPPREPVADNNPLECVVASYATSRLQSDAVNALRKQSSNLPGDLGNSVLRHSDEQTLTALVAVKDAISHFESPPENLQDWGVVASSRYLGRTAFAQALNKFAVDGPWNVSVQVVPNRSLHSPASMVGLALGCHGPCVGVGGGLDGEPDAWLTATSLLDQHRLPGIWLIFSGWEPDEQINLDGVPTNDACCTSLAIALQPSTSQSGVAKLRIVYDPNEVVPLAVPAKETAMRRFENFVAGGMNGQTMTAMLGGGLRVEMNWSPAVTSTIPMVSPAAPGQKRAA